MIALLGLFWIRSEAATPFRSLEKLTGDVLGRRVMVPETEHGQQPETKHVEEPARVVEMVER